MKIFFAERFNRKKSILFLLLIFCTITIIISGAYHYNAKYAINSQIMEYARTDSQNMSRQVGSMLDEADRISSFLINDNHVKNYLLIGSTDTIFGDVGEPIKTQISAYRFVYEYIHSICLYSNANPDFFFDGNHMINISLNDGWKEIYDNASDNALQVRTVNNNYPIVLTFIRKNKYGAVVININIDEFSEIKADRKNTMHRKYLIDEAGKIVYKYGIKSLDESITDQISRFSEEETYLYKIEDDMYAVSVSEVPKSKYKCVVMNKVDASRINSVYVYTLLIVIALFIVGACVVFFINILTVSPLKNILSFLDSPDDTRITFSKKEEERIAGRFIQLISANENLRAEIVRQTELGDELRKYALGLQINPHFISSTLNLAHMSLSEKLGDDYDDDEIIIKVSKCIAYIMRNSNDLVTVREELQYSRIFIDILRIKSNGKVNISLKIDNNVSEDARIIKLCINTLIENAFYHGISARESIQGNIDCRIYRENYDLICVVSDDGVGMKPDMLEKMEELLQSNDIVRSENIGLVNIQSRIKLLFGNDYGLSVKSEEGIGTQITLRIPYQV